ncbi:hypothetical protein BON30_20735 [Cystobacter ferrugineus]|uniref:Uncharacterized protein n=1 Tax=Cystobacter ferrugineus TaxID=83449 RepID=A0A1L9B8U3_9BACT|nr:hypothetical protein BON30_20735 [Cystobacter ferrugineus]
MPGDASPPGRWAGEDRAHAAHARHTHDSNHFQFMFSLRVEEFSAPAALYTASPGGRASRARPPGEQSDDE